MHPNFFAARLKQASARRRTSASATRPCTGRRSNCPAVFPSALQPWTRAIASTVPVLNDVTFCPSVSKYHAVIFIDAVHSRVVQVVAVGIVVMAFHMDSA
jgi:hypothetical protein